ncbi:OmpA/MotB family protein [Vagococcus sp.]|uniref:OmpA/MotB family protein n=1 Tax=Vagococcus sp. TaxID=1933889 RepID=UPI003F9A4707
MKRRKKEEHHVDEGWLLPYSDMLTLLLALFIVMFAMAKTDSGKLNELSDQFNIILSGQTSSGNGGILPAYPKIKKPSDKKKEKENEEKDTKQISQAGKDIKEELTKDGHGSDVEVNEEKDGVRIVINSGLLFSPGSSTLAPSVGNVTKKIGNSLKKVDNEIIIAGYTDSVPNPTSSNWELSASRAISVMDELVKQKAINEKRVSIQAYGEFRPKKPNNTEKNRAENRRVEIFIVKKEQDTK